MPQKKQPHSTSFSLIPCTPVLNSNPYHALPCKHAGLVKYFLSITLQVFNFRTMLVKFASCACAVGSGLPVGPEGPMIHIGAMIGAALSQGHSTSLGINTGLFTRFRNPKDKRDFVTAGAWMSGGSRRGPHQRCTFDIHKPHRSEILLSLFLIVIKCDRRFLDYSFTKIYSGMQRVWCGMFWWVTIFIFSSFCRP